MINREMKIMAETKGTQQATQQETKQSQQSTKGEQKSSPAIEPSGRESGPQTGISRRRQFAPSQWAAGRSTRPIVDEMDRLFDDFLDFAGFGRGGLSPFGRSGFAPRGFGEIGRGVWSPEIEVFEREGQLVVRADLPGLNKDDVKVDVTDDLMIIQGERRQEHEESEEGYYRSERSYGSFYRSIPLPEGVSDEDIKANFRDGVLEITMPAPQREQRGRRIEIGEGDKGAEQPRAGAQTTTK